ncbi:MAG TPA: hypothetical protein VLU46_08215 [Thermoanaerobaculia bacterium]|nr:hypothetical protein [Thermoanaerobaculia bacterium]
MAAVAAAAIAADVPLFPAPLHLVRRVEDPIANTTSQIDEYCTGNRIVTVDGYKTVVADYDKQELLQIDRATSTYSVARFDEIAAANALTLPAKRTAAQAATRWMTTVASGDRFEIASDTVKIELAVDHRTPLSRKAFDALTGASYPNASTPQQDAVARAAARSRSVVAADAAETYGIPVEQSITFDVGTGGKLTIRNTIVSITSDLPPPEVLAIPAGAKLVPSRAAQMRKFMEELKDPAPHP